MVAGPAVVAGVRARLGALLAVEEHLDRGVDVEMHDPGFRALEMLEPVTSHQRLAILDRPVLDAVMSVLLAEIPMMPSSICG